MKTSALVLLLALGAGWLLEPLPATTIQAPDDLPKLVARAGQVSEVLILGARPVQRPDGVIETRYTFSTILPMKGLVPSVQEVRIPGGTVAGRGLYLPGMPALKAGDRAILFLSGEGKNGWRLPVGLASGAFQVLPGMDDSSMVIRDTRLQPGGGFEQHDHDSFVQAILEEVARQG
ncbi:MAG: hypothetical protein ACE5H3_01185 [Planctomycetota bacterium]